MQLSRLLFFATAATGLAHGHSGYGGHHTGEHCGRPISSTVDLGYAKYKGTTLSAGVNQYLGMRFARPPLGYLRWRAPVEPEWTAGVQSAEEVCLFAWPQLF